MQGFNVERRIGFRVKVCTKVMCERGKSLRTLRTAFLLFYNLREIFIGRFGPVWRTGVYRPVSSADARRLCVSGGDEQQRRSH